MCYHCLHSLKCIKTKQSKMENSTRINYIFLDLRISSDDDKVRENTENKSGFIPKTIILEQSELNSENVKNKNDCILVC